MIDVLLVINGMLLSLVIGGIIYYKYTLSTFSKLVEKQKQDMETFAKLHEKTLQRNKNYEEEMSKLITTVNDLKAKPLNSGFGGRGGR